MVCFTCFCSSVHMCVALAYLWDLIWPCSGHRPLLHWASEACAVAAHCRWANTACIPCIYIYYIYIYCIHVYYSIYVCVRTPSVGLYVWLHVDFGCTHFRDLCIYTNTWMAVTSVCLCSMNQGWPACPWLVTVKAALRRHSSLRRRTPRPRSWQPWSELYVHTYVYTYVHAHMSAIING